ncbi:sialin-like [Neocloeon triangulifer]|uniref:sialin-like n=1 Tax=Neocloeon triangulifer TaxID=2078957 RepID=UPI00286F939D|nr:sialin-like [Neocloeon triangulifer]
MALGSKGWLAWANPNRIPARGVLGVISFFGFFVNYMLRVNMNIAIVSMTGGAGTAAASDDFVPNECISNSSSFRSNTTATDDAKQADVGEFAWDSQLQGIVLGSFYWSYIVSLVPGGMLAERYGTKIVYGGANLVLGITTLATPVAARLNFWLLISIRLIQGLAAGMTWPAMHSMTSRWIPPHERSKFVSTYMGNAVGTAVTYPLCGILIDAFGWESAFYVPALICISWCVWWWFCAFDSPAQHPRISPKELAFLQKNVTTSKEKLKLPLREVLKSPPFWALMVANTGSIWAFMTVITYGPTYLKVVHGFNIRENGLVSGLPNVSRFLGSLFFSWIIDSMIATKKLTITVARKVATATAEVLPAILFLLMGNVGCNATAEVAILTLASLFGGCASSGPIVNSVDLAPNFSGSILGLISIASMSGGFLVPLMVGAIIRENQSMAQWRIVFLIASVLNVFCTIVFSVWGSGEVQSWNDPKKTDEESSEAPSTPLKSVT